MAQGERLTIPKTVQAEGPEATLDWLVAKGGLTKEALEKKVAALRGKTGERALAAATVETSAVNIKEKTLPPEQAEFLISTLRARFSRNERLHKSIKWKDVEKALRAQPDLLWRLAQLEATDGEPDVLKEENDAFIFADFSKESPFKRKNVVFDAEAEAFLRKHYPNEVCDGNAADKVAAWGVEFMSEAEYRLLQELTKIDARTWSWLRTPADVRQAGGALRGVGYGGAVGVNRDIASNHDSHRGFRCSLRVPKV